MNHDNIRMNYRSNHLVNHHNDQDCHTLTLHPASAQEPFQCWLVNWSSCKPPGRSLSQPGFMDWFFLGSASHFWVRPSKHLIPISGRHAPSSYEISLGPLGPLGTTYFTIQSIHKYTHKPSVHQGSLIRWKISSRYTSLHRKVADGSAQSSNICTWLDLDASF